MSKILSCRIDDNKYYMFVERVKLLNTTNNILLGNLVDIFLNLNEVKQPVGSVFDLDEYERVSREVNALLGVIDGS